MQRSPDATAQAFVCASSMTASSPDLNVAIPHVSCLVREKSRLMPLEEPRPSCSVSQSISLPLRPVTRSPSTSSMQCMQRLTVA